MAVAVPAAHVDQEQSATRNSNAAHVQTPAMANNVATMVAAVFVAYAAQVRFVLLLGSVSSRIAHPIALVNSAAMMDAVASAGCA